MKARIQMIIGLLFVAITISMIAVSFAWYSAEGGSVSVSGTSVTITTSDNNFYDGATGLEFKGCLTTTDNSTFTAKDFTPYRGEDGITSTYILLVKATTPIYGIKGNGYINSCYVSKTNQTYEYNNETESDFKVVLLDLDTENSTESVTKYKLAVRTGETEPTYQYFAIIFTSKVENENTVAFTFSDSQYIGTSFTLNIYLNCNETETNE